MTRRRSPASAVKRGSLRYRTNVLANISEAFEIRRLRVIGGAASRKKIGACP
jgi:hypothetical protein